MPKVSIVIPMYNEERYISRCLESLKKQTFKDFEVILIDDGSKDGTVEIASKYDVKILKQEHGGPWKARNWWAKEAKWDTLVFVDADMFFDEKYLEKLTKPVIAGQEVGTNHGTELVGNLDNPIARAFGIVRWVYDPKQPRSGVYRSIDKSAFISSGWFDSSKGYFDDDLSKVNGGKGSLNVEDAICYHNNPEGYAEIFRHSVWVWKGLVQGWALIPYAKAYKIWIISFIMAAIGVLVYWYLTNALSFIFIAPFVVLTILIIAKSIQRSVKEGYASHLLHVPVVITMRGAWYAIGILRALTNK